VIATVINGESPFAFINSTDTDVTDFDGEAG